VIAMMMREGNQFLLPHHHPRTHPAKSNDQEDGCNDTQSGHNQNHEAEVENPCDVRMNKRDEIKYRTVSQFNPQFQNAATIKFKNKKIMSSP
jgi:hypothetical protein